jgi:hypothetical protein
LSDEDDSTCKTQDQEEQAMIKTFTQLQTQNIQSPENSMERDDGEIRGDQDADVDRQEQNEYA